VFHAVLLKTLTEKPNGTDYSKEKRVHSFKLSLKLAWIVFS